MIFWAKNLNFPLLKNLSVMNNYLEDLLHIEFGDDLLQFDNEFLTNDISIQTNVQNSQETIDPFALMAPQSEFVPILSPISEFLAGFSEHEIVEHTDPFALIMPQSEFVPILSPISSFLSQSGVGEKRVLEVSNEPEPKYRKLEIRDEIRDETDTIIQKDKIIHAIRDKTINLSTIPYKFWQDKQIILEFISCKYRILKHLTPELLDDSIIVRRAINVYPDDFAFASLRLKDDLEFAIHAVKLEKKNLKYVSERLRNDECFAIAIVKPGMKYKYLGSDVRDSKNFVMTAINKTGSAKPFEFASLRLRGDLELATLASNYSAETVIRSGATDVRTNKDLLKILITKSPCIIKYAPLSIRTDLELNILGASLSGLFLAYTCAEMRDNDEVVRAAVMNDPTAIRFASIRLQHAWKKH